MTMLKEWFTVDEAAEYLCVSRRTIYKLTREQRLPAFHLSIERHRRFRRSDLDKVLQPGKQKTESPSDIYLNAQEDPILTKLWVNERDSAYDSL